MLANRYKIEPRANLVEENLAGANLAGANLNKANLRGANLHEANLAWANLHEANLNEANLAWANLAEANLTWARLRGANLREANLVGANLVGAYLVGVNLRRADLRGADLRGANLFGANLSGAKVAETCLDPENIPNGDVSGFERCGRYVIGYRTREAGHIDKYRDGRIYTADWFSTCAETDCHPGLYVWPTLEMAKSFAPGKELIRVYVFPHDVHKTPTKWRCRMFEVVGGCERAD